MSDLTARRQKGTFYETTVSIHVETTDPEWDSKSLIQKMEEIIRIALPGVRLFRTEYSSESYKETLLNKRKVLFVHRD